MASVSGNMAGFRTFRQTLQLASSGRERVKGSSCPQVVLYRFQSMASVSGNTAGFFRTFRQTLKLASSGRGPVKGSSCPQVVSYSLQSMASVSGNMAGFRTFRQTLQLTSSGRGPVKGSICPQVVSYSLQSMASVVFERFGRHYNLHLQGEGLLKEAFVLRSSRIHFKAWLRFPGTWRVFERFGRH
jgi:hypothetical protein